MKIRYNDLKKMSYLDSDYMHIPDEVLEDDNAYSVRGESSLGMKPVGQVYFDEFENLNYTNGMPVERPYISGGELGMRKRYLTPGTAVYTAEQVVRILNSQLFTDLNQPKLSVEVAELLDDIAKVKGENRIERARHILDNYTVVGEVSED